MYRENPISPSELKSWLENLPNPAELEHHTLTQRLHRTEIVQRFLSQYPEQDALPAWHLVCLALREFWRSAFMQRNFSPKLKRVWNTFFILEAAYFYPAAVTSLFPGSLNKLGALLCDQEYLALLAADGDESRAKKIASEKSAFWKAIIPDDEVPSPQTISSRRDAAIEKLAKELNRQLEFTGAMLATSASAAISTNKPTVATEVIEPPRTIQVTVKEFAVLSEDPVYSQTPGPVIELEQSTLLRRYQEQANTRVSYGGLRLKFLAWPQGDEVSPSDLDAIVASLDIAKLMNSLDIRPTPERCEGWREDRRFLIALMDRFAARGDDDIRLQCAACLRHIQLSRIVEIEVNLRSQFWKVKRLSALESIARIALDLREDEFTRSLAEAILGQETYVEQLWNLGKFYAPLAHKLTITLGKYLYYDEHSGQLRLGGQ